MLCIQQLFCQKSFHTLGGWSYNVSYLPGWRYEKMEKTWSPEVSHIFKKSLAILMWRINYKSFPVPSCVPSTTLQKHGFNKKRDFSYQLSPSGIATMSGGSGLERPGARAKEAKPKSRGMILGGGFQYFSFSPGSLGKWSILTSIFFQMGWFNHQL